MPLPRHATGSLIAEGLTVRTHHAIEINRKLVKARIAVLGVLSNIVRVIKITISFARLITRIGLGCPALWAGRKSLPAVGGLLLRQPHGSQTDQSCGLRD